MSSYRVLVGDVRESLRTLDPESVQCVVTSPPYWGLRDYGVEGQIGLEETPEEYLAALREVFREIRRVLKKDGTLWMNMGDTYAAKPAGNKELQTTERVRAPGTTFVFGGNRQAGIPTGYKPKDLMGIPWRLALALQANGWYLRQDIIWNKPNPMPSSVQDRCTTAHEYLFLLSKSARYYYDNEAIKTDAVSETRKMPDGWDTGSGAHGSFSRNGREKGRRTNKQRGHSRQHAGFNDRWDSMTREEQQSMKANKRSVWTLSRDEYLEHCAQMYDLMAANPDVWRIATAPYSEANFATFPPKLIEPCILAGSRPGDTVLDPFGGSGTTAGVALEHDRDAILCELNPAYIDLIPGRIDSITDAVRQARLFKGAV